MYIVAKRKDYYDGVVGTMGMDKSIVYIRETQVFENWPDFPKAFRPNRVYNTRYKNHFLNLDHHTLRPKSTIDAYSSFIVGFCGKLYIGWKLYTEDKSPKPGYWSSNFKTEYVYDYDEAKKYIHHVGWFSNLDDDVEYIKNYNPMDIFRELKVPIFIYDHDYNRTFLLRNSANSVFIVNPLLSEYEFYKVIDSFAAFQEISMFMGGVLGSGEKEIVEVADKYKIGQHGFDKWSFRKMPEKK